MLNQLSEQGVRVVGLNYKDKRQDALQWLQQRGDPYEFSLFDVDGLLGIDLGVYGAPETFLLDAEGVIHHRRVGVVDERVWAAEFAEVYQQLRAAK
jgi:cytochrome c biogenesis protein CcmG/thiol:disulfide interchange protein DsbE